jgi:chromosome partitioning protein
VLAQPFIAMRNDHQDALAAGLAVGEYAPSGKSATEIRELWQWIDDRLNGCAADDEESASEFKEEPFRFVFGQNPVRPIAPAVPQFPVWRDVEPSWDARP